MLSPGGGAGMRAAASSKIRKLSPQLLELAMAFDTASKEQQAILRAVTALNIFGRAEPENLVSPGLTARVQGGGVSPPPGMAGGAPPGGPGAMPPIPPPSPGGPEPPGGAT